MGDAIEAIMVMFVSALSLAFAALCLSWFTVLPAVGLLWVLGWLR